MSRGLREIAGITLLFFALSFLSGCAQDGRYPDVSSISGEWLEIKMNLWEARKPRDTAALAPSALESNIDDFIKTLETFFSSPVGSLYRIHHLSEMDSLAAVFSAAGRLKTAAANNDGPEISALVLEIDRGIDVLRRIDSNLLDTSQLNAFRLFFFFSVLIIMIITAIKILYGKLEKTQIREQSSLSFSRETMMAQEAERSRIARELHDSVAQDLWRLSFQTDNIDKAANPAERSRLCAEVVSGQKELMTRIRTLCGELIPPAFGIQGLDGALRSLCFSFAERSGIACGVVVAEPLNLAGFDKDTQLQCFRVAQECFANIEKHSGATEAAAELRGEGDVLVMRVNDNGKGFSAPGGDWARRFRVEGHFGLWNMYERAAALGGTLAVESEPERGTTVTLRVPMPLAKEAEP